MKIHIVFHGTKWLLLVSFFLFGCTTRDILTGQMSTDDEVSAKEQTSTTGDEPPTVINFDGKRFVRIKKAVIRSRNIEEVYAQRAPAPQNNAKREPMSVELLAEKLRPVALFRGWEYIAEEPDYELARKAVNGEFKNFRTKGFKGREGRSILGTTDDRSYAGSSRTSAPYKHLMFFEGGGTGNMIGLRTTLTAGHVLFQNNSWIDIWHGAPYDRPALCNQKDWPVNDNSRQVIFLPTDPDAGRCLTRPSHQNDNGQPEVSPYGFQNCFMAAIPHEWWDREDIYTDFGVINYMQNWCPGNSPGENGYIPIWMVDPWEMQAFLRNKIIGIFGYPEEIEIDPSTGNGTWVYQPGLVMPYDSGQMWGMSTVGGIRMSDNLIIHTMDTSAGQSGSCLWVLEPLFNDYICVGVHTGWWGTTENSVVSVDSGMLAFIMSASDEY